MITTKSRTNSAFNWDAFDPNAYNQQYEDHVILEDRGLGRAIIGALLELGIPFRSLKTGIDACNGGVLRGPSLISPYIADARDGGKLYWSEFGRPQRVRANELIEAGKKGDLGKWKDQQTHMARCHIEWADASFRACTLGEVVEQSVFELPQGAYDIGITCFGPESLTEDAEEWQLACKTFFRSVKKGHPVIMVYMEGSKGYGSAGIPLPAVPITQSDVLELADGELRQTQTFSIAASHGARPKGDPFGYSGMGAIVGLKV